MRIDSLEPDRLVEWTPVGGFEGWIGTSIAWRLEPTDDGATVVHFAQGGWPDDAADGEMAMPGYTWAMIIERLSRQVAGGERAPYFRVRGYRCPDRWPHTPPAVAARSGA